MYPALIEAAVQDQRQQRIARARAFRIARTAAAATDTATARDAEQAESNRPLAPASQPSTAPARKHRALSHPVLSLYRWLAAGQL